jgi:hypothetical protein
MPVPPPPYQTDQIFRTRDVVVFVKSKTIPVMISPAMAAGGWPGGQGVQWIDDPNNDTFLVTYSSGQYGGFLLWGSNEPSDQYVAYYKNQPTYNFAVMAIGSWVVSTTTFEQYTYASRIAGPPYVPNVFIPGNKLRFSLRGYFTPEDEWTLSGDPRAPNNLFVARVIQPPNPNINSNYLEIQSTI